MHPDRWEHGSDYAWPDINLGPTSSTWFPPSATYWHSGRDALRALVRALRPGRVLFPSFYCQDVLDAAEKAEVRAYVDGPDALTLDVASLDLRPGDLVLVTNPFGLRRASPFAETPEGVTIVEDHTHDPLSHWARSSNAPYAFASLRKWFPIPDGGMLWSPSGRTAVDAPAFDIRAHVRSEASTLARLSGMLLKQRYLAGENVSKEAFRAQAIAGERTIGQGDPEPMSPVSRALLDVLPAVDWRERRLRNHQAFAAALRRAPSATKYVRVLTTDDGGSTPFTILLVFERSTMRDAVRASLVQERIYPAVLWPIDAARAPGIPSAHVDLSKRILCLHCDHRYVADDMERVAGVVLRTMEAAV